MLGCRMLPSGRTVRRFIYLIALVQLAFVLASGQIGSAGFCKASNAPPQSTFEKGKETVPLAAEIVLEDDVPSTTKQPPSENSNAKPKANKGKRAKKPQSDPSQCYCQLSGKVIHDTNCLCDVNSLIDYTVSSINPILQKLVLTDYFRFYKLNINRGCSLWDEDYKCATDKCGVTPCDAADLPGALRATLAPPAPEVRDEGESGSTTTASPETLASDAVSPCPLSQVHNLADADRPPAQADDMSNQKYITELSNIQYSQMVNHWDKHDKEQSEEDGIVKLPVYQRDFCPEQEADPSMAYYDLLKNPERYTGYAGPAAHKIWREIYDKNCYEEEQTKNLPKGWNNFMVDEATPLKEDSGGNSKVFRRSPDDVLGKYTCAERRVFYRAVSGLHSSISIHLTDMWYDMDVGDFSPNLTEFERRFEHDQGESYIHNLYFVWLLELRALHKASPYIVNVETIRALLHTGDVISDIHAQSYMLELLKKVDEFPMHFDESHLFRGTNAEQMMEEFRSRMFNIQEIMDCVDCEKCRLWGKLQTHGLSTAVKILLTPNECIDVDNFSRDEHVQPTCPKFFLQRRELVALVNAFARLSNSVTVLERFKDEIIARKRQERQQAKGRNTKKGSASGKSQKSAKSSNSRNEKVEL